MCFLIACMNTEWCKLLTFSRSLWESLENFSEDKVQYLGICQNLIPPDLWSKWKRKSYLLQILGACLEAERKGPRLLHLGCSLRQSQPQWKNKLWLLDINQWFGSSRLGSVDCRTQRCFPRWGNVTRQDRALPWSLKSSTMMSLPRKWPLL